MKKYMPYALGLMASLILGFGSQSDLYAQQTFGGKPLSMSADAHQGFRSATDLGLDPILVKKNFNIDDIVEKNSWQQMHGAKPLMVGHSIPVSIDFSKSATPYIAGGKTVYRLAVKTNGAKGIALYYKDFFIPKGGKLFIYTPDYSVVNGAYTYETHPEHGSFATEPMPGNEFILEYDAPANGEMPSIKIDELGYFFRSFSMLREAIQPVQEEEAESCQINVNCPDGNNFQKQKNGVVEWVIKIRNGGIGFCTGDLMNNTAKDFKPYILSAAHCVDGGGHVDPNIDLPKCIFGFHYEKIGCSSSSFATPRMKTLVGAQVKAFMSIRGKSDGLLLELSNNVPDNYRVYYNGWDRRTDIPLNVVGIHHPAGDAMKISTKDDNKETIVLGTWKSQDEETRQIINGGYNAHFHFEYNRGSTEGGSSGSSLFNMQNGLVVGTLTGGGPRVNGSGYILPCSGSEFYGRLAYHWDHYANLGTSYQMKSFLDPNNTGVETLEGTWKSDNLKELQPASNLKVTFDNASKHVNLSWTAPVDKQGLNVKYIISRNGNKIATVDGTSYTDNIDDATYNQGALGYTVQAIYMQGNSEDNAEYAVPIYGSSIVKGLVTKVIPTVTASSNGGVTITWHTANTYQLLTRYAANTTPEFARMVIPNLGAQVIGKTTVAQSSIKNARYYDLWALDGMADNTYISQINIMPQKAGGSLTLCIGTPAELEKGSKEWKYTITVPVSIPSNWKKGSWYPVVLPKPYKIDPSQLLYIGLQIDPPYAPPTPIMILKNSADRVYPIASDKLVFNLPKPVGYQRNGGQILEDRYWLGMDGISFGFQRETPGYMAISPVIFRSKITPDAPVKPITDFNLVSPIISNMPMPVGYELMKNGKPIKTFSLDDWRYYKDPQGTASDKYEVNVLYGEGVDTANGSTQNIKVVEKSMVTVYPTIMDNVFYTTNSSNIKDAKLYSVDGKLVAEWNHFQDGVGYNVSNLPSGAYVLSVKTNGGRVETHKLFKK